MRMVGRFDKTKIRTFPQADDNYSFKSKMTGPFIAIQSGESKPVATQLTGSYNFTNIAAALSISTYFDVDIRKAESAIAAYSPSNNRSQIVEKNGNTIIMDAYNANPTSMLAALENFAELEAKSKMVVLGDMLELGDVSDSEHRAIGSWLNEYPDWKVILCGKEMINGSQTCSHASHFEHSDQVVSWIKGNPLNDTAILIKGSRGMRLEKIQDVI